MYIPILKNRTIEMSVVKELLKVGLSNQTIPMLEIIQLKSRTNSSKTFIQEIEELFNDTHHPFLLDIPKINITSSTAQSIQEFMTLVNRQKNYAIEQLVTCKHIPGIVPVLSYNIKEIPTLDILKENFKLLRSNFSKIALRMTPMQLNKLGDDLLPLMNKNDIFLLDIGDKGHTNPAFKKIYKKINSMRKEKEFITFIINANRPSDLYNKNIVDGEPIEEIDNSLLEMYGLATYYKFDGFGDYACVTNTLPSTGGSISPAGIYYSLEGNFFVGYKGRSPSLSEFSDYIAPSIIASEYWLEFDKKHHLNCPGCIKIQTAANDATGKSQGIWKGITMSHYIYSVDHSLTT